MTTAVLISLTTSVLIVISVLLFPRINLRKISFDTYWIVALGGALTLIIMGRLNLSEINKSLLANTAVNPIKILTLFLSMTILSIYLDEVGFFRYLANLALKKAETKQFSFFISLYLVISFLTVFTSNDIIILTFTPFICCLARRANVNPIPYLVSEFVAANTWSMMLVIGNPTNIYLATMYQINFIDYFKTMLFPTVLAGLTSFIILALTFRKELKKPFVKHYEASTIKNKFLLANGLIHLGLCTIVLSVSSFLKIEMWFVSLIFAISLIITTGCYQLIMRDNTKILYPTLKRTPWNLVPFVISMFIIVLSLNKHGATALINKMLGTDYLVFKYGFAAFFSANLINNIPMSVLFAEVVRPLNGIPLKQAVFSAIAGSNIGAYFTPIGALAGLMWMSILKKEKIEFSFFTFIKKHFIVSVITMSMALIGILIMVR